MYTCIGAQLVQECQFLENFFTSRFLTSLFFLYILSKYRRVSPKLHSHHFNVITVSTTVRPNCSEDYCRRTWDRKQNRYVNLYLSHARPITLLRYIYAYSREKLRKRKRMRTRIHFARLSFRRLLRRHLDRDT